jgi:hypothetical protein
LTIPGLFDGGGTDNVYLGIPGTHIRSIDYNVALIKRAGDGYWLLVSGGAYGTGKRMKIAYTRAMVRAALNGAEGIEVREGSFPGEGKSFGMKDEVLKRLYGT